MATLTERHSPSFCPWPINNDRTAWRPFGLPIVLVIPHARDTNGLPLANSIAFDVSIVIEGAPVDSIVAGHDHVGLRYPDRELYRRTLSTSDLLSRQINTSLLDFETATGEEIADRADVKTNDIMKYTTATGIFDKIVFIEDADYYDLSDIQVETENLSPNHYNLIYTCNFYVRVVTNERTLGIDELVCIDINQIGQATLRFGINHPGEVMLEFYNKTPPVCLTNASKSEDNTVAFYRPITDILQDIYDEQKFIKTINWVNNVPYEGIPYLSQLLGWDVPYFPESLDQLRRLILRKTRELQLLKGSRRAVRRLMNLFGFTILFKHIWYAVDGTRYITPGERLPAAYADQAIQYVEKYQVEPLVSRYTTSGFGEITTNLLFRPQRLTGQNSFQAPDDSSDLTVDAYLVAAGSDAEEALLAQVELMDSDPEGYGDGASCIQDENGFINVGKIQTALNGLTIVGHSQLLLRNGYVTDQANAGISPPLKMSEIPGLGGTTFDKEENTLNIIFGQHIDFTTDGTVLYIFTSYKRQEVVVPADLADLRSNRFVIQVTANDGSTIRPDVLDFVLDFIHKIKSFNSLLDSIQYSTDLAEAYTVTDLCVGGNITQRYDTAIGRQQVPPAIIPTVPGENCAEMSPEGLGYKASDLAYRRLLLRAVIDEYEAWKKLDSRVSLDSVLLRLAVTRPTNTDSCKYTAYGQDRIVSRGDQEDNIEATPTPNASQNSSGGQLSPYDSSISGVGVGSASTDRDTSSYSSTQIQTDGASTQLCEPDGRIDYCYKGRVGDSIITRMSPSITEIRRNLSCGLSIGSGMYWMYPTASMMHIAGTKHPDKRSSTRMSVYSGGANDVGQTPLYDGPQGDNLLIDIGKPLAARYDNLLGRLLRAYGQPISESIHYSDRYFLTSYEQSHWLAIQRPSLDIKMPYMHFPGCRFPTLDRLAADYVSTDWSAKPWDDNCGNSCCSDEPTWLNARLVDGTDGNQSLTFDSTPYRVTGNGSTPDISSLGEHDISDYLVADDVVHAVYSSLSSGHPAIELDDMDECGTPGDTIAVDRPLFSSASESATGGYIDFCDGYPSEYGYFSYSHSESVHTSLFTAMGVPAASTPIDLLFYLCSGVLDGTQGIRLDCGCQVADDSIDRLGCATDLYLDQDGEYDFGGDHILLYRNLVADEDIGIGTYLLDGSIPSLMEVFT